MPNLGSQELDWVPFLPSDDCVDTENLPLDFDFTMNPDHDCLPEDIELWDETPQNQDMTPSTFDSRTCHPSFTSSTSISPTDDVVSRSIATTTLTHLRHGNPASKHAANLITHIIFAFPQMMLRRQTFPPFINAHWHLPSLPEGLAGCMSVAQLFATRTPETRPFLWRMIDAEERHFREEV